MDSMAVLAAVSSIVLALLLIGFVLGTLEIFIFEPRRQLRRPAGGEDEPW